MAQSGSLIVRVYASRAQLPIQGATVLVSQRDGQGQNQLYSALVTDESGIAGPISLPAPDADLSQNPGPPLPFASYSLVVEHPGYQVALFQDLQIFSGVETTQSVPLIPLSIPQQSSPEQQLTQVTPQPL